MPEKCPQTCVIRPQKSMETLLNVAYCKAVRIRDGLAKFGWAPKISPEYCALNLVKCPLLQGCAYPG